MSLSIDQVIDSALALPDGERLELVEAILASFRPEDRPPFDEAWRPVIERRSKELASGEVAGIPWSEVKRRGQEQRGVCSLVTMRCTILRWFTAFHTALSIVRLRSLFL